MNGLTQTVRVVIDASAATSGAAQYNAALDSMASRSGGASSANENTAASSAKLAQELALASSAGGNLGNALDTIRGKSSAANDNIKGFNGEIERSHGGLREMVGHLGTATLAVAGLGFALGGIHALVHTFTELSDESTEVTSRLLAFTHSSQELAQAQEMVVQVANKTRSGLPEVAELFQKIGIQADHLHLSLTQVGVATTVFAETLKLSGSTQQQSKSAMLQLGEAFDIGQLNGRHFIAMMMDNIVFMRLLATSMGVPIGKLKEMSSEGLVTADAIKKALTDPKIVAEIEARFGRLPVSFAQVRTGIKNSLIQLVGDFANGAGINTSLGVLYANISKLGTDLKPTFEKIGVAARAAFQAIVPAAQAAIAVIGPIFSSVLDNAPELIKLLKVAAETWLVYRAALLSVAAVNGASMFITSAQSLAMFINLAKGGAGEIGLLKSAFILASEGVDILTVSLLANPFIALAVGVTAIVALLYEFRDSINLGGGSLATLGDLFRAVWGAISPLIATATGYVKEFAGWINDKLGGALKVVGDAVSNFFGMFDFSILGALRAVTRFVDFLITGVRGAWMVIRDVFSAVPGFLQWAFASAANLAIGELEGLANAATKIVNGIATGINSAFHTSLGMMSEIKLPRLDAGNIKGQIGALGAALGKDATDSTVHGVERGLEGLVVSANRIGAHRRIAARPAALVAAIKPKDTEGKSGSGDDDAGKKAKEKVDKELEFWKTLENEVATAKLFGIEAAKVTEEQKLQKILGHDLTVDQKARVDGLVQQIANEKAITDLKKSTFELNNKTTVAQARQLGLTEAQGKIQDALDAKTVAALDAGVDIKTKSYQESLAEYRVALERNAAQETLNNLLKSGLDIAKKYSPAFALSADIKAMGKELNDFLAAYATGQLKDSLGNPMSEVVKNAVVKGIQDAIATKPLEGLASYLGTGSTAKQNLDIIKAGTNRDTANADVENMTGLTPAARDKYLKDIAKKYQDDMDAASTEVADALAKKVKDAMDKLGDLLGKIGGLIGGKVGGIFSAAGDTTKSFGDFATNSKDTADTIKAAFDPNGNSGFVAGLSKAVGGAVAGLQIGESIGKLGTALGLQGSETGAKIGGAIGGLTGNPLIAAAASVIGGLISSLFYKPPHGTAVITGGAASDVALSGSNAQVRGVASGLAGNVQSQLANYATQLGATVGAFNVSIGTFKDNYRVSTTGYSGSLDSKHASGLVDFGTGDAAATAAITFAVKTAISQGALQGLSDFANKAVNALDIDAAVQLIKDFNSAMKDFAAINDPISAAVTNVTDSIDALRKSMVSVGASTDDLTKLDQYRAAKVAAILKDQTSSIRSFIDSLTGDTGGVSKFAQLTASLAALQGFDKDILAGKAIDQDAFQTQLNKAASLNSDVYGTNTAGYQGVVAQLGQIANDSLNAITTTVNKAAGYDTTSAINQQTDMVTATISIGNDLQTQANAKLDNIASLLAGLGGGQSAGNLNGLQTQLY